MMFRNDENKQNGQAIKIARETMKHLQRQHFSFTKTSIKMSLKMMILYAQSLSLS